MAGNQAVINTKLTADGSELARALNQGIAKATDFRGQMMNIGKTIGAAFTVGAMANFASNLVRTADEIQDAAGALALTTDELQAFDAAANKTAGGVEGMRAAIKKLVEVQAEAKDGNTTSEAALLKLGLGTRAYSATTSELVKALADYYKRTGDLATVHDLFGRQAVQVREVLDEIAGTSISGLVKKYDELGQVIDQNGIKKLAEFKLMMEQLGKATASGTVDFVQAIQTRLVWLKRLTGTSVEEIEKSERALAGMGEGPTARLATDSEKQARKKREVDEAVARVDAYLAAQDKIRAAAVASKRKEIDQIRDIEKAWLDEIQAEREKAFDWQIALADADISARTPGQRPPDEWFGSALNKIGAIGSVRGSSPELQLNKEQVAVLKEIAKHVAPIKNIVLGTFVGGQ